MQGSNGPFGVFDLTAVIRAESYDTDASVVENQEIVGRQQEASDLGLPQLVALVLILDEFGVGVYHKDAVGVDSDRLVAHRNRLSSVTLRHQVQVTVAYVELVVPVHVEE